MTINAAIRSCACVPACAFEVVGGDCRCLRVRARTSLNWLLIEAYEHHIIAVHSICKLAHLHVMHNFN